MSAVLLLNASYEPLRAVGIHRAIRLVIDGKAEIEAGVPDQIIRSKGLEFPRPSVIRLTKFIKVPYNLRRTVTNTFLFARDNYTCQYCGKHQSTFGKKNGREVNLEREHVMPQSRGGDNTWTNLVAACTTCNTRKADKTPEEAGMHLLSVPVEPQFVRLTWSVRRLTEMQQEYVARFYGEDVVRQLKALRK